MAVIVWYLYRPSRTTSRAVKPPFPSPRLNALSGPLYRYPFSRQRDLQFDSRPMEIYGAVNLIDSALTRRVAGSFVWARMSDIKKLSAAQWPARFGFLQVMTRRECTVRMRSRIIYLSYPWRIMPRIALAKKGLVLLMYAPQGTPVRLISSLDDSVMRYNGGLFWVELKSRCEAPINEKFERRARKRATGHGVINTRYNTQCTCSDSAEV